MRRLLAAALCAACAQDLSVHVRGGDRPPDPGYRRALEVSGGAQVDRFRVVLRKLRLQSQPTDGGPDSAGMETIGPGPYLVELGSSSLTGGALTMLFDGYGIGAKGYYELDIELSPVTDADVAANPALAPMLGKTFVIEGRNAAGAPFTFESSLTAVLVRSSVFRLGMNHNNIDVNVAPNVWFGSLDPADPLQRGAIEANVLQSVDAYEDDNLDGAPDPLG